MNKVEKLICLVLGGVLAWYLFFVAPRQNETAPAPARPEGITASSSSSMASRLLSAEKQNRPQLSYTSTCPLTQIILYSILFRSFQHLPTML
jgi:hypothetical protein